MLSNRRIRQLADAGNRTRIESYIKENARRANDRMRGIEKRRPTSRGQVYNIAKYTLESLNKKRFGGRLKNQTIDELEKEALTLNNYLRAQTSTYRGLVQRERRILQTFQKKGINIENPDLFFQILQSDLVSNYADIDSGEVVKSASQWANSDDYDVLQAIKKAQREYESKENLYIDEAFKLIDEYTNE